MRNIEPYKLPGRWYKFFIESDGTDRTITTSDLEGTTIASGILKLPEKYRLLDWIFDAHNDASSVQTLTPTRKYYADGTQGVSLPAAEAFDYMDAYIYAYKEI